MKKILIIRFSSFGDIIQCMSVLPILKQAFPEAQIDWVVREDMKGPLMGHPLIDNVISFPKKGSLLKLWKFSEVLNQTSYDLVYDAHSNLRSFFLKHYLNLSRSKLIVREKERIKRILLFKLRKNRYQNWPFKGMKSYQEPLKEICQVESSPQSWHEEYIKDNKKEIKDRIFLIPSSAWDLKKWPIEYWKELILALPEEQFVILGGPEDTFTEEIVAADPERVINLAGKLSLAESCSSISLSKFVISGDTGLIHVADLVGAKGVSLIGPSAFGFPTHENIQYLSAGLECQPCSKDGRNRCTNKVTKKCLYDIKPDQVISKMESMI